MKILDVTVTPIAFRDPPLLNASGVHEPLALRTVVQLEVEGGVIGFGEGWGEAAIVTSVDGSPFRSRRAERVRAQQIESSINEILDGEPQPIRAWSDGPCSPRLRSPATMRRARSWASRSVTFWVAPFATESTSAPTFSTSGPGTRPRSRTTNGAPPSTQRGSFDRPRDDRSLGIPVDQAEGGCLHPDIEIATIQALAAAFPGYPLRIDPNGAWRAATARRVAAELSGVLEYLEDPVARPAAMSEIAREATMPLATNMCVVAIEDVKDAVLTDAVQIVLSDHHYWGGLRHTRELGAICAATGLGVSMHSNSHLGISLAAMAHVAAATPNLDYACDTHYPWNHEDDVVSPGSLRFEHGALIVPTAPGLGVEVDQQSSRSCMTRMSTPAGSAETTRDTCVPCTPTSTPHFHGSDHDRRPGRALSLSVGCAR